MNTRVVGHVFILNLILCLSLPCVAQEGPERAEPPKVSVSTIPSAIILYREVTGPYNQHPEVFAELMKYVETNYRAVGACFGIYPQDPDAVKAKELHWEIGVRVVPGIPLGYGNNLPIEQLTVRSDRQWQQTLRKMRQPESPYGLKVLPKTDAAVVDSTVSAAAQDGLAMFPWMATNGYVQVGATRMEYLSHEGPPSEMKVTIIVPVKRRPSGLRLNN
jgi:hypothetical protein